MAVVIGDIRPVNSVLGDCSLFERLLSDLSTKFTNLPPGSVDSEITQGLRRIVEFIGTERSTLFEFSEDERHLYSRYSYAVPGHAPFPEDVPEDEFSWYVGTLRRGEVVVMERLPEDLPSEAVAERQYGIEAGVRSHLAVPLNVGEKVVAAIAICSLSDYQQWPDELIQRLRVIGEVFANALVRKRIDYAIRLGATTFSTVFQNAPVAMLLLDGDRRVVRINHVAEEMMAASTGDLAGLAFGNAIQCLHSLDDPGGCGCGSFCSDCPIRQMACDTFEKGQEHRGAEV